MAYASHANSHKQQLYCLNWPLQFMVCRYESRDKMDAMQTNEKRKTSNTLPQELLLALLVEDEQVFANMLKMQQTFFQVTFRRRFRVHFSVLQMNLFNRN